MSLRVVIAGGGTGGHLFPGVALAEELLSRDPRTELLFVGTARGIEATVVPQLGHRLELLEIRPLKGRTPLEMASGLLRVPRAVAAAARCLRRFAPDLVVGVGGYASGPTVLAARLLGVRTAVLEQNSVPGITNRVLGRLVDHVFTAFAEADRHFPRGRTHRVGNPLRRRLIEAAREAPPAGVGRDGRPPRLLIVGGSQGAHALNELAVLAVETLAHRGFKLSVRHQTGKADLESVAQSYASSHVDAEAVAFIERIEEAYGWADAVLCRAGALTLAELCLFGRPSLLVPLPTAADDHQRHNAFALEQAGAAVCLSQGALDALLLAEAIRGLLADPERCDRMARAARALARPEAASQAANILLRTGPGQQEWGGAHAA